jgi:hypothetical protein
MGTKNALYHNEIGLMGAISPISSPYMFGEMQP